MISTQLFLFAILLGAVLASVIWSHRYRNLQADLEWLEEEYYYSKYDPREK